MSASATTMLPATTATSDGRGRGARQLAVRARYSAAAITATHTDAVSTHSGQRSAYPATDTGVSSTNVARQLSV
jgi:hypothetical protein